jgi:DNA-directed RNA polymerase specialized sigma24 family protein
LHTETTTRRRHIWRNQYVRHHPTILVIKDVTVHHKLTDVEIVRFKSIQVEKIIQSMDDWTRKVWVARQYGYSWREIAAFFGLTEAQAKLRFRYAIGRLRAKLGFK